MVTVLYTVMLSLEAWPQGQKTWPRPRGSWSRPRGSWPRTREVRPRGLSRSGG